MGLELGTQSSGSVSRSPEWTPRLSLHSDRSRKGETGKGQCTTTPPIDVQIS